MVSLGPFLGASGVAVLGLLVCGHLVSRRHAVALCASLAARAREREAARKRARSLLLSHLDDVQRHGLERHGAFCVTARSGHRYRISTSAAPFNVRDETTGFEYCLQFGFETSWSIPVEDLMLAEKLLLECDEAEFLATANRRSMAS